LHLKVHAVTSSACLQLLDKEFQTESHASATAGVDNDPYK